MSTKQKISRRRFLMVGAGAVGATVLALGGLAALGRRQPAVEFVEPSCGTGHDAQHKILIAYASHCGSTGEVAQAIGQVLCEAGAAVDVRLVKNVSDLSPYRAVIVGSSIRSSNWLPEAVEFVKMHRDALSRVPVAYFLTCLALVAGQTRSAVMSFLDPVRDHVPQVQPVDVGLFKGKLDFGMLPFVYRFVWPLTAGGGVREGDYRDWEAIRSWATELYPKLGKLGGVPSGRW
jgi:menaquinone-dependent protoporphyrinogen oxidase